MRWPAWANWMRQEQNSGRGIRSEETVGKQIRGVVVLVGDGVMAPMGTWWRTLGPGRGLLRGMRVDGKRIDLRCCRRWRRRWL